MSMSNTMKTLFFNRVKGDSSNVYVSNVAPTLFQRFLTTNNFVYVAGWSVTSFLFSWATVETMKLMGPTKLTHMVDDDKWRAAQRAGAQKLGQNPLGNAFLRGPTIPIKQVKLATLQEFAAGAQMSVDQVIAAIPLHENQIDRS